ncbi:MAG TPA: hypothetical protein HPP83_03675 [Candidatus Hydrogenedentes bacterium]|nr:hypothetical protein [Candidatus Hydrogenedentota bacterium]
MEQGIQREGKTGRDYFTGYEYKMLYDWDQYFEAIVQIYMGWPSDLIKNAVTIFLDHQHKSGHIPRSVPSNALHDSEHVKPFLAQIAALVKRYYGEADWILNGTYYPKLKRYLDYWLHDMDANDNGLSEWMSAPHSGMDNQHERAGHWHDRICEGVDLNCYLCRETSAMAELAADSGHLEDTDRYRAHAASLKENIRDHMWDDEDGAFYDLDMRTGVQTRVRSCAIFMPLWAQVATKEQARQLVYEHLANPNNFWTPWPVSTMSRTEPGYSRTPLSTDVLGEETCNWRATVWVPVNYMIYHGLKNYGYTELASTLAYRTRHMVRQFGNHEWYDAETGEGRGLDPFWGWTLLAHFLEFEERTGEDPTQLIIGGKGDFGGSD